MNALRDFLFFVSGARVIFVVVLYKSALVLLLFKDLVFLTKLMNGLLSILVANLHVCKQHVQIIQALHQFFLGRLLLFILQLSVGWLVDSGLHLVELRLLLLGVLHRAFVGDHAAHELLRILDASVYLVLADYLRVLG